MSFEPAMPPYNASDPSATFLSSSCLDFLLIELVPLAYRITNERDPSHNSTESKAQPGGEPSSAAHRAVSLASVHHSSGSEARKLDEEEELDAVHLRLDVLGFSVARPRFLGTLDVIKFLCKDLWSLVFGKNIDNLKTNHRFLWFPCGVVRGALAALGISATVQAEINELPGAVFQIKTLNSKP
ncbi:hypothetical protein E4U42_006121 [Claviceps africana]|uniref:Trafficking protein particle complex subunit 6B n=1 Tax=Claviceps africana TaxID=83212 RepID=A0A8K0NLC6_9HYPO|nr:hypothetical protein E4U42_006121 [Claviceps africana]